MPVKPETRLKVRFLKRLRERGAWAEKIQQRAIRGTPDVLACWKGWFCAFELKTDDGALDKLQEHKLGKILEAGGIVDVIRPDDMEEKIDQWEMYLKEIRGL